MMSGRRFWKKAPAPYWRDLRAWSLLIPALAATLGAVAYSVQGIAVSQGGVLPAVWVDTAVRWGAVMLGIGCEGGTISACIEIARKRRDGDTATVRILGHEVAIDGIGLAVSYCATVIARMLALHPAQSIAIIGLLVIASVADAYFLFTEAGEYLSIRDRNVARWETARWYYEELHNLPAALAALRSDEPLQISDEMRSLKEHLGELQSALQQSNREEERMSGELSAVRAAVEQAEAARSAAEAALQHAQRDNEQLRAARSAAETAPATIPEHLRATLTYYSAHPGMPYAQAARDMERAASTVRAHVNALCAAGAMRVNGNGAEVLEV